MLEEPLDCQQKLELYSHIPVIPEVNLSQYPGKELDGSQLHTCVLSKGMSASVIVNNLSASWTGSSGERERETFLREFVFFMYFLLQYIYTYVYVYTMHCRLHICTSLYTKALY